MPRGRGLPQREAPRLPLRSLAARRTMHSRAGHAHVHVWTHALHAVPGEIRRQGGSQDLIHRCTRFFFRSILYSRILLRTHYGWVIGRGRSRSVLTKSRVRTGGSQGNQIHSVILWTLGIPKMYMGTLGYNVQIPL